MVSITGNGEKNKYNSAGRQRSNVIVHANAHVFGNGLIFHQAGSQEGGSQNVSKFLSACLNVRDGKC